MLRARVATSICGVYTLDRNLRTYLLSFIITIKLTRPSFCMDNAVAPFSDTPQSTLFEPEPHRRIRYRETQRRHSVAIHFQGSSHS